jgi:5-methylcytosine-specific restriction endonuclease McrA
VIAGVIVCPDCDYTAATPGSVNFHRGKKHPGAAWQACLSCGAVKQRVEFVTGQLAGKCAACRDAFTTWLAAVREGRRTSAPRLEPRGARKSRERLIREAAAPGVCTAEQRAARWAYYGGKCWMCGDPAVCMDHVKPLSRGGGNWPSNQRPSCWACNGLKAARWPFALARTA